MKVLIVFLSLAAGAQQASAATVLYFTSSPLSFVGRGDTISLTPPTTNFIAARGLGGVNSISFLMFVNHQLWSIDFLGPGSTTPVVGFYPDAARAPFQGPGQAGLDFSGRSHGDNTLTGKFQILESNLDGNGAVLTFAADFVQFDGGDPEQWIQGSIRYNSDIPLSFLDVPEPSSFVLAALGLIGLVVWRRRGRQ